MQVQYKFSVSSSQPTISPTNPTAFFAPGFQWKMFKPLVIYWLNLKVMPFFALLTEDNAEQHTGISAWFAQQLPQIYDAFNYYWRYF